MVKCVKYENTKKKFPPPLYYGESSKNSVVGGAAGVEFSQELCVGSSEAAWYASAKRAKVSCELVL